MRLIFILLLGLLVTACGAKSVAVPVESGLMKVAEPQIPVEIIPSDFEKSMPSSSIIRQSLIIFEYMPRRIYSDSDVINISADKNIATVLKPGEISFTMPMCSGLVLDGNFTNISLFGYNAAVYGSGRVDIYSSYECARFASLKRALRGGLLLLGDYLIEWEGTNVVLREAYNGNLLYNGNTGIEIASAGIIGGKIALIHKNGYIMVYNEKAKIFALEGNFPVTFNLLNFAEDTFYGTLSTGEFFTINDNATDITTYKDCLLSHVSPYALCGNTLIGGGKVEEGVPSAPAFAVGAGFYMTLKDNNVNIYTLDKAWQRFVSFGYSLPEPCRTEDGAIYFNDLSGDTVKLFKGTETFEKEIPKSCNNTDITFNKGKFICKGKECGTFAVEINSDPSGVMYKRRGENKEFYYFVNQDNEPTGIGTE